MPDGFERVPLVPAATSAGDTGVPYAGSTPADWDDADPASTGRFGNCTQEWYLMSGNAWEWVNDRVCISCDGFDGTPVEDPVGSADAYNRVLRSGRWDEPETNMAVSRRFAAYSVYLRYIGQGFRLARTAP